MENANTHVSDVAEKDFEAQVLEKSRQVPVLVDFWAPWCQPCKTLGPVLESLAAKFSGRFHLVKVNMDESPVLAQLLQIKSIPNVKLFVDAKLRDEFSGAYPEAEIEKFLNYHLPPAPAQEAPEGQQGLEALASGNLTDALPRFQKALEDDPEDISALLGLGFYYLEQGEPDKAREFAEKLKTADFEKNPDGKNLGKMASRLSSTLYLYENANKPPAGKHSDDFRHACESALKGGHKEALETLLGIVGKDRSFGKDAGRLGMLAVFDLLEGDSPLLAEYRTRLSNILFS
ncbi:MAG: tetratricopeptide repeat protein [Deltaproteobacteria bacterium]|nr:tetratricopeptide repeat protein [Deltaproteobacteria bacterium]